MEDNYLDQLNPQQRAAVLYTAGPQLVIAGAGSGKTRVLTYKIVHLLNLGVAPWQIMALTFTNKAAREMRDRVEQMVDASDLGKLWMGTFHSIFARILRFNAEKIGFKSSYTIYDASDSLSAIKHIIKDLDYDDKVYKPSTVQNRISMLKNAMVSPADYATNRQWQDEDVTAKRPNLGVIYRAYWNQCRSSQAMDFDDLLFYTNVLLRDHKEVREHYQHQFKYILVDEYQDTNFAQDLIIKQLSGDETRVCVVGDDAQSIYSFRGANIDNILNLQKIYPGLKIFKLEQNYRSTQNILDVANSLIAANKNQYKKHIFTQNNPGKKVRVIRCSSDYEESYIIANTIASLKRQNGYRWNDFAVLYRTNSQSRIIEKALNSGGLANEHGHVRNPIPYRIYGGLAFFQRKEVKDALAYFKMVVNPDDEAIRRIINYPRRGIGESTIEKIHRCAVDHATSMWQVISSPGQYQLAVNRGTLAKLASFKQKIDSITALNATGKDAYEVARGIIEQAGLITVLMGDNTPENISRQENLQELLSSVKEYVDNHLEETGNTATLAQYLTEAALATDQDNDKTANGDCVTLMTVHAAKGLEYKNVIISGVEDGRFPSYKSQDSLAQIEEERRLLYVAITRAKENCIMLYSDTIVMAGKPTPVAPSRFLMDIDQKYLIMNQTSFAAGNSEARRSLWSRDSYGCDDMGYRSSDAHNYHSGNRDLWNHNSYDSDDYSSMTASEAKPQQDHHFTPPAPPRRLTPMTIVKGRPSIAGGGSIHSAAELHVGSVIKHSRFGEGTVTSIDTVTDAKIQVNFNVVGSKLLLLRFAKFDIIG